MRTKQQIRSDRAILKNLRCVPAGYLLPEDVLRSDAPRFADPALAQTEIDDSLLYLAAQKRIASIATETGIKYQLTDAGRLWLAENL